MSRQKKLVCTASIVALAALLILIPLKAADPGALEKTEVVIQPVPAASSPTTPTLELLEILRIWMLAHDLELSKEQMIQFTPLFEELQRVKQRFGEERRAVTKQLQDIAARSASEEEEIAILASGKSLENAYWQEVQRIREELNQQLTPRQQVKFALFNETYRQKMQQLIAMLKQVGEAKQQPHINQLLKVNP